MANHVPSSSHSDFISSLDFEDTSICDKLNLDSLLEIENEFYKLLEHSVEAEPAVESYPLVQVIEDVLSEPLSQILEDEDEQAIPFPSPDQDYRPVLEITDNSALDHQFNILCEHHDVATDAPLNVKEVSKSAKTIVLDKRTSKPWSFDTISPLFHLPASQAAKELNIANHVSSSSAFTNQIVYPSSDASEYPFWDAQCEQFPLTYFNAINNDEPLLNMDFDPFWNFEHNLERLIGDTAAFNPLGMDGVLLPSASVIPIECDITPTSNAVAVKQDTTTGTKESMIEKIVRRQSKRAKKNFS
nr:hypothetical protein Iba_chr04dCG10360 [Ipomoea batatas]